ncbi:hypothetical protein [Photobacterium sanguinicancri]|uniref:Uncharacterized protein n=1 Tax=Photobacterium sanguinicancri TaxID=875932 RepID=A0ABX4FUL7_9GAMM|nr:hypothetical protein [Photobacterium sanguinicancri]OZS42484.1 hypothetical protein ASV53_18165 [Photobacterium sanguinicancri]
MKVIKYIAEVEQLNLPSTVKKQLMTHILEPWSGDVHQAQEFWEEVSTRLILIEQSDTDHDLAEIDEELDILLCYAIANPEFVLLLNDESCPHLLALSVHTDEGSGCYVLGPMSSDTHPIRVLKEQAE